MPTCFVATYGSGKPVIGLLGEFDALPMLSQKGRVPYQNLFLDGAPGHGCGHNTLIAPTATILFPGGVPGAIGHHWSTVACTYGSTAWKGLNAGAKAIAASTIDLLTKPEELDKLKTEFEEYSKDHPYKPLLPEDAVPPLDLNKELMKKWRPVKEQYYLNF